MASKAVKVKKLTKPAVITTGSSEYFVSWQCSANHLSEFSVVWYYATNKKNFIGSSSTVKASEKPKTGKKGYWDNTYTPPAAAISVWAKVKPVSTKDAGAKKNAYHWTGGWKGTKKTSLPQTTVLPVLDTPTLENDLGSFAINLNNIDTLSEAGKLAKAVEFDFHNATTDAHQYAVIPITDEKSAKWSGLTAAPGCYYEARARSVGATSGWKGISATNGNLNGYNKVGEWSSYTDQQTSVPTNITSFSVRANSETEVVVTFSHGMAPSSDLKYRVEYATESYYLETNTNVTSAEFESKDAPYGGTKYISGLETGKVYYFRMCAENGTGVSGYTSIVSLPVGSKPNPPTIWSASTVVNRGDKVTLYWVHNSKDGSSLEASDLKVNGTIINISNDRDDEHKDEIFSYELDTSQYLTANQYNYVNGFTIFWQIGSNQNGNDLINAGWSSTLVYPTKDKPYLFALCRTVYADGKTSDSRSSVIYQYSDKVVLSTVTVTWCVAPYLNASDSKTWNPYEDANTATTDDTNRVLCIKAVPLLADGTTKAEHKFVGGSSGSLISGTSVINWQVATKGAYPEYSDWSEVKTIQAVVKPEYTITLRDSTNVAVTDVSSFPVKLQLDNVNGAAPVLSINMSVKMVDSPYEDFGYYDNNGEFIALTAGSEIYSRTYIYNGALKDEYAIELDPGVMHIANGGSYNIDIRISHTNGTIWEGSIYGMDVFLEEIDYDITAIMQMDEVNHSVLINPYVVTVEEVAQVFPDSETIITYEETIVPDIKLNLYRIDFDGGLTEIATNLNNTDRVWVSDDYPSLNVMRYRITALNTKTGNLDFADITFDETFPKPTGIILQWNDIQRTWESETEDEQDIAEDQIKRGSSLTIYGNVDISDKHKPDAELVEYIGREHPVSYYGTQVGQSSSWSCEFDAEDTDTIDALRRLQRWMGDVHVREPSGSSYWAQIEVSFSIKHTALTIPVTLGVTRVEGKG